MNGASKILTVSYGTFSCTLEGFDDPFNTMKAIAEYFRDLAAGDRYFGAEPPTPDAAMLHQIAEREIQRRVEAKIQDNGVVLRASEHTEPAVATPAPSQIAAPLREPEKAPVVTMPAAGKPAPVTPTVAPASAPAAESVVEKLSRLRSEIAAQPGAAAPLQTAPVVSFALPDYLEDQDDDTLGAADAAALADFLPEDVAQTLPDLPEEMDDGTAPVDEMLTEAPMVAEVVGAESAEEDAASVVDVDLAAVMAEAETPAETVVKVETDELEGAEAAIAADAVSEGVLTDAEVAEAAALETRPEAQGDVYSDASGDFADLSAEPVVDADHLPESLMAALADTSEDAAQVETSVAMADQPAAAADDDYEVEADAWDTSETAPAVEAGEDSLLASLEAALNDATEAEAEPATTAEARDDAQDEDAIWAETWAETVEAGSDPVTTAEEASVEVDEAEVEPVLAADEEFERATMADDEAETIPMEAAETAPQEVADAPAGMELRPGAAEKLQRARARVIRIRKSDDGAVTASVAPATAPAVEDEAMASSAFAEVTEDAGSDQKPLLSAEDEAELQRELAALRRGEELAAEAEAGLSPLTLSQDSRRGFEGASADEALGRLMEQTDTEMEGSDTKRRQSAIQHLKAAVAATVADRKVTGEKSGEMETVSRLARYRNDLAMAVKAALPGGRGAATGERPAPLVLVSEQRIDRPRPPTGPSASAGPIRPRRVTSGGMGMATATDLDLSDDEDEDEDLSNVFGDSKGFSEFVERVGATSFEQILEASAAYMAGIEGRPHFSRPQLMRHLTAVIPQETFQREDGLRSFGTLLRDGRIAKVRRGQFMLSEESKYLVEARKQGQ